MKRSIWMMLLLLAISAGCQEALAMEGEPTVYVIQKGDTLWGLSEQFLKDPYYWPDLWARNQRITNPHFIFPGQKLRIFPDRIEVVNPPEAKAATAASTPAKKGSGEEGVSSQTFMVTGGEGFLMEPGFKPYGFIVSTYQNRQIVGEDDIVYIDIGKKFGVKVGDRFSIFKKLNAVSHPVTNVILGYKVVPLGTLQVSETEDAVSKAIITQSYMEIGPGSFLGPYRENKRRISLKSSDRDFSGYIVDTKTGNKALAAGDIVYLDLGKAQGLQVGNMLYVVRDVTPDQKFADVPIEKLPVDVLGAVVVVDVGQNTSTALIIKSIDTIYRGDRVESRKNS